MVGQSIRNEHSRLVLAGASRKAYDVEALPPAALRSRLKSELKQVDVRLEHQLDVLAAPLSGLSLSRLSRATIAADEWDGLIMLGYLVAQRKAIIKALETV